MKKITFAALILFVYSNSALSCDWMVTVSEQDNELVSINLGKTVPPKTSFKIANIASCNVLNDGHISTVCTFNKTKKSVAVSPLDTNMGKVSNMAIFDGTTEDDSKKYIVLTMCPVI